MKTKEDLLSLKTTRKGIPIRYWYTGIIEHIEFNTLMAKIKDAQLPLEKGFGHYISKKIIVNEDTKYLKVGNEVIVFFDDNGNAQEVHILPKNNRVYHLNFKR